MQAGYEFLCFALLLLRPVQVRRHTEAAAEELQRAADQEEQLTKAGAGELAVSQQHTHAPTAVLAGEGGQQQVGQLAGCLRLDTAFSFS
jgi:hypothetical protein